MKKLTLPVLTALLLSGVQAANANTDYRTEQTDAMTSPVFLTKKGEAVLSSTLGGISTELKFKQSDIKAKSNAFTWSENLMYGINDYLSVKFGFEYNLVDNEKSRGADFRSYEAELLYRTMDTGHYAMTFGLGLGQYKGSDVSVSEAPRLGLKMYNGIRITRELHTSINLGVEYITEKVSGASDIKQFEQDGSWGYGIEWLTEWRIIEPLSFDLNLGYKAYSDTKAKAYSNFGVITHKLKEEDQREAYVGIAFNWHMDANYILGVYGNYIDHGEPKYKETSYASGTELSAKQDGSEFQYGIRLVNRF